MPITKIEDTFIYNGNNLRSSQDINGTTTKLTWDTAEELPLILEDETNSYIYGPENLPIEQISSGGETLYFHHDQQGSTRLLTGSTGKTEAAFTYNPYGTINADSGKIEATPLLYDAQYTTNSGSGAELIYLQARTYDPNTAQFLTVDPEVEETGESYSYASDNPLNASDPTGNWTSVLPQPPPQPRDIREERDPAGNLWVLRDDGFWYSRQMIDGRWWAQSGSPQGRWPDPVHRSTCCESWWLLLL